MPTTRKKAKPRGRAKADGVPYEISDRVTQQARTRPYSRPPGAPLTRPLRIFTLDPSVSVRIGGVATVNVPYEVIEPGPVGSLLELDPEGAPPPLKAERLDLDHPYHMLANGVVPSPANGQSHLQMVGGRGGAGVRASPIRRRPGSRRQRQTISKKTPRCPQALANRWTTLPTARMSP